MVSIQIFIVNCLIVTQCHQSTFPSFPNCVILFMNSPEGEEFYTTSFLSPQMLKNIESNCLKQNSWFEGFYLSLSLSLTHAKVKNNLQLTFFKASSDL